MRMSELSEASGVPVATIKYYLREELLHRGEATGPNQADYGDDHVKRLRLIRALIEVGGIGVAAAKSVLAAIDSDIPIEHTFRTAQAAASEPVDPDRIDPAALDIVDHVTRDWYVEPDGVGRRLAASALTAFHRAGQSDERGWVERYARAALLLAEADLDEVEARDGRAAKAEIVVVGTVLGDALIAGLRRAAQASVSAARYYPPGISDGRRLPPPPA